MPTFEDLKRCLVMGMREIKRRHEDEMYELSEKLNDFLYSIHVAQWQKHDDAAPLPEDFITKTPPGTQLTSKASGVFTRMRAFLAEKDLVAVYDIYVTPDSDGGATYTLTRNGSRLEQKRIAELGDPAIFSEIALVWLPRQKLHSKIGLDLEIKAIRETAIAQGISPDDTEAFQEATGKHLALAAVGHLLRSGKLRDSSD